MVGDQPVTPVELEVREVISDDGCTVIFKASLEPTAVDAWAWSPNDGVVPLASGSTRTVGQVSSNGGTTVMVERSFDKIGADVLVYRGGVQTQRLRSVGDMPSRKPNVHLERFGSREIRTAVIFPTDHQLGSKTLPILVDSYGGPHGQRVTVSADSYLTSQWFADNGFAVVVADGRGTPGRGAAWERAIYGDFSDCVLEDQIEALTQAVAKWSDLDASRVAIRGWSFGGYLAALAVLRRPDIFHAAVAGAPCTDWRLYDTHYTERYLGDPNESDDSYAKSSIVEQAADLTNPLMLIHGFSDDNVLVAHSVRLSSELTRAARPHTFVPLPSASHMVSNEATIKSLLELQVDFLMESLA